ncbi:uncharacterized protein LOC116416874 isoform X1 [Nasonia vitripennis]|uniref:Uncharacterized protein n=1 Tax=Nasonia vitripennis TaxID=7425 RepID=A0A7M7T8R8_NASVI|nr:uncharacterized protein LOC116416874 isoform X1 [Nasonia vitripennis]
MNKLSTAGIPCTIKNQNRTIKVYALIACVDTVARAPMNGTSQFNSKYGCDWCLHKGYYYNGSMRYPFENPLSENRNHKMTIEHATQAVQTQKRVFGVKTASPLLNLQNFDIIDGFTPDYMHCYVAGVGKQFTEYIVIILTKTEEDILENIFQKLKVPNQLSRLSRSLKACGKWKAREYENWILYYSITLLSLVLKNHKKILKHWSLLVNALHICLQIDITFADLNYANEMLFKFVAEAEDIYSLTALTYNAHQLLHIVKSIYNWGPLYCHSSYAFEAANHKLLKSIHGAKGVISQIIRYESIERTIQILEKKIYSEYPGISMFFCENLISSLVQKAYKVSNITYINKVQVVSEYLINAHNIPKNSKVYHKIVYGGSLFMTSKKKNKRSCNYYAQLTNGKFVELLHFIINVEAHTEWTICRVIKTKTNKYANIIREVSEMSDEICIKTHDIHKTCVFIEAGDVTYIIPTPNQLFY